MTDDLARLRSAAGVGPHLEFIRVPDITAWTRVRLDLRPYLGHDQAAEVARLRVLGTADADIGQGADPWVVRADIEGSEFLRPHAWITSRVGSNKRVALTQMMSTARW
ncbi:VOC family protein [Cryobacterium sp. Y50]|uniref:VOC family protein n=1 Tax=Cryobacterium sp. Y50 TaxID=2048286 RepID=UPI001E52AB4C|nr:VOC family protein [Cryobacterium sp. Y50]